MAQNLGAVADARHVVIGAGDSGIYRTVALIKQQIQQAKGLPQLKKLVADITQGIPSQTAQSQAIVKWFMNNIHYRHDDDVSWTEAGLKPINLKECPTHFKTCEPVELIYTAPQILQQRFGDCDDFVLLLSAMHQLAGMRTCPVVVALDNSDPQEFSHIYMIANLDGSWVPIDAVNQGMPWGWEAPNPYRKEILC